MSEHRPGRPNRSLEGRNSEKRRREYSRRPPQEKLAAADNPDERVVVGLQPVREAIRAHGARLQCVLVATGDSPQLAALERFARDQNVADVRRVTRAELDQRSQGVQHQGALALAPALALVDFASLLADKALLALALDRIQDPQNFGAVVRSAVAIGNAAVLWGEHSSAPLTTATFRASAGAVEHARLCRVPSLAGSLQQAREAGVNVIGLAGEATTLLSELTLAPPCILVVGSESLGLQSAVRRTCTQLAALVHPGRIASLNASVAAAVALYEAVKSNKFSD